MSTIHSSSELLGLRSALRCGTARFSTVRSIEYSRHGSAMTARPIHSRRVAGGACAILTEEFVTMDLVRGKRLERSDH